MGVYPATCIKCNSPFLWFSGHMDQRCADCVRKENKDKEDVIDKFMEENSDLMDDLSKQEEVDKLRNRLKQLKSAHTLFGILIKELEDEIQK